MVIIVEFGCYFIEVLLVYVLEDFGKSYFFVKLVLEVFCYFGGVRLEDDVLVILNGCENFIICLCEIEDVEVVMKGRSWLN